MAKQPQDQSFEAFFAKEIDALKRKAPLRFTERWLKALVYAAALPSAPHYSHSVWLAYYDSPDWTVEVLRVLRAKVNKDKAGWVVLCRGKRLDDEADCEAAQCFPGVTTKAVAKRRERVLKQEKAKATKRR